MAAEKPTYNELEAKLAEAEKMINAIRNDQIDPILTKKKYLSDSPQKYRGSSPEI
jgi:hypothetical protein